MNGGIIDVKSELLSSNLLFTGSPEQDTIQSPSIKIPKALLNERSNGESAYVFVMYKFCWGMSMCVRMGLSSFVGYCTWV